MELEYVRDEEHYKEMDDYSVIIVNGTSTYWKHATKEQRIKNQQSWDTNTNICGWSDKISKSFTPSKYIKIPKRLKILIEKNHYVITSFSKTNKLNISALQKKFPYHVPKKNILYHLVSKVGYIPSHDYENPFREKEYWLCFNEWDEEKLEMVFPVIQGDEIFFVKVTLEKIKFKKFDKRGRKKSDYVSSKRRRKIFSRDGYCCVKCGASKIPLNVDHIIPRFFGGTNDETNLETLCFKCNIQKKHKIELEEHKEDFIKLFGNSVQIT